MSNINEHHRAAEPGGRRLVQNQNNGGNRAPKRRTKKRPIGATIMIRLFQLLGTLILIGVVTSAFMACYAAVYIKNVVLPKTDLDLSAYTLNENSVIYYPDKETGLYVELATLVGEKNSEWVDLEDIPQDLINAVVAIEDKRFWSHNGVDWYRTGGAVVNMFFSMRNNFGGSTITQQLIKNQTGNDDVTVTRKIQEIFTALELEKKYKKEDILELYLNLIYLGDSCYGVQAASEHYFGKSVSELSLAECAALAGITNNPSLYGPNSTLEVMRYQCSECEKWTNTESDVCPNCGAHDTLSQGKIWYATDYNKQRQETILREMLDPEGKNGVSYITEKEYEAAVAETLRFVGRGNGTDDSEDGEPNGNVYSWYVEEVISEVRDDLMEKYDLSSKAALHKVYSGGLSIYTNFDPEIQAAVDQIYNDRSNLDHTSQSGQQIKSAITIVDNSTGYVVALAGDVGQKEKNRIWNYATDSPFQPGSSLKPLSVYAPALEMGLITPSTVLDDNPVRLEGDNPWPKNDQGNYKGLMTVQTGVADSRNTIALRTLHLVTPEASYQFLTERFGFTTLVESMEVNGEVKSDIGESPLAMGGLTRGVTTMEMAAAFATFPRNGAYTRPTTYLKVEDNSHEVLLDNTPETEYVLKPETAYYMNAMLTNAVQAGTGTPAKISGMTVAGKTGTTNNSYARWFAGYTPYYTGVVWVGYQNNERITGFKRNPAVVLWQQVMSLIHENLENKPFEKTVETVSQTICLDCGKLAAEGCKMDIRGDRTKSFEFAKGDEPVEFCTCHVPITVCTESPILDASGNSTGRYYLAGEFCPDESCQTVYVVEHERELITEPAVIGDYTALKAYYDDLGSPTCPLHTGFEPEPSDEPPSEDPWWDWPWNWPWESDEPTLPPETTQPAEPETPSQEPELPSAPES